MRVAHKRRVVVALQHHACKSEKTASDNHSIKTRNHPTVSALTGQFGFPSLWSSASAVAQFSVQKPTGQMQSKEVIMSFWVGSVCTVCCGLMPGRFVQTPPFWHVSCWFQQLSYVRAQPELQAIGQATDSATPVQWSEEGRKEGRKEGRRKKKEGRKEGRKDLESHLHR
jgi:hypothetical protein